MMDGKNFLSVADVSEADLRKLLESAIALKAAARKGRQDRCLAGKQLGLIFEKPSMRTRISFESGMVQLGGYAVFIGQEIGRLGVRDPIRDLARITSSYLDALAVRTFSHDILEELAREASIPVINALSDYLHPCQALADLMTVTEAFGKPDGAVIAFIGDGNNVARSLARAAAMTKAVFRIASPEGYALDDAFVEALSKDYPDAVERFRDPNEAVEGADVLYTDSWISMGQEAEQEKRERAFRDYQINEALLARAKKTAIVMHCLPAYRGKEITAAAADSPQSVIYQQAENRLHTQKALLKELLTRGGTGDE